jgi:hypothetical protein
MSDAELGPDSSEPLRDDDDTEGQAFKWNLVEDEKGKAPRLRQTWTPDEPRAETGNRGGQAPNKSR